MADNAKKVKVGMFGGGGVGKTCLTLRFLKGEFTEGYIPTIEDEFSKIVQVNNQTVSLSVVDTAGQDDFSELRFSYYSQVDGFVFVFDVSNKQSVDDLMNMYDEIDGIVDDVKCVVAANKIDLRDDPNVSDLVPVEEYKNIESKFNCNVIETSSLKDVGVEELFDNIIKKLLASSGNEAKGEPKKSSNENNNSNGCCLIA